MLYGNDYHMVCKDRKNNERGGGVACCIKNTLTFSEVEIKGLENYEYLCIELKTFNGILKFCCLYIPPWYSELDKSLLFEKLSVLILKQSTPIIIIGDFNEPDIDWNFPDSTFSLCKFTLENGLQQLVKEKTRTDKTLDLLLCSNPEIIETLSVEFPFSNSDHN
jgi:hypothetical protein